MSNLKQTWRNCGCPVQAGGWASGHRGQTGVGRDGINESKQTKGSWPAATKCKRRKGWTTKHATKKHRQFFCPKRQDAKKV